MCVWVGVGVQCVHSSMCDLENWPLCQTGRSDTRQVLRFSDLAQQTTVQRRMRMYCSVCVTRVLVWHAIPSFRNNCMGARRMHGCMYICLCGVSDMEWIIMLLNYANCLWSPTVGNQFQCLCTTVPLLLYWRYMHTNESGNTTNRVHLL